MKSPTWSLAAHLVGTITALDRARIWVIQPKKVAGVFLSLLFYCMVGLADGTVPRTGV